MLTGRLQRCVPSSASFGGLDQEFSRMVNSIFSPHSAPVGGTNPGAGRAGVPPINAWEDEQNVYVEAELPGYKFGDLDIGLLGRELTLSGTRDTATTESGKFLRRERQGGQFSRTLRLGIDVDGARVAAKLDQGVLTVTLPKAEAAKPRKITIQAR